MRTRRKNQAGDARNFIIFILSVIVAVETFLLLNPQHKSILAFKSAVAEKKIQKRAVPEKIPETPLRPRERGRVFPKPVTDGTVKKLSVGAGRIAVILDDWGYHLESCSALKAIRQPVAVAVLPGLEHSRAVARCAHEQNKVVMLHLPLEPHQYLEHYPVNYIITTNMRRQRVERILEKNLDDVPFVAGVNNHMGSRATEDRRLMSIIFARLKERGLFFVDSMVTNHSICRDLTREMHIDFARRDVFLDNKNERGYIENQFVQLAKLARQKGSAVAIGHDRPLTLKIVQEQLARLEKEGFQIVKIQEFLQ